MELEGTIVAVTMVDTKENTIYKITLGTETENRSFFISLEGLTPSEFKELTNTLKMGKIFKLKFIPINRGKIE